MPRLIPGQTLPVPELSQATYTPYSELGEWLEGPPPAPNLMKTAYPQLRAEDLASPEWYEATKPINDMEMLAGLAQTVDYFTGAPVRAGLGEMLKPGDSPMGGLVAFIKQFSKHPSEAPTGAQLATQMGITSRSLEDISPIFGGILARTPINKLAGFGIEAVADISPLAAMTLPGGRMFHGSPHYWKKADISKVGTGEGAQAFGHGLYVTDSPKIAEEYAKKLAVGDIGEISDNARYIMDELVKDAPNLPNVVLESAKRFNYEPDKVAKNLRLYSEASTNKAQAEGMRGYASLLESGDIKMKPGQGLHYTTEIPKGEYLQWHETPTRNDLERIGVPKKVSMRYEGMQEELNRLDFEGGLDSPKWNKLVNETQELRKEYPYLGQSGADIYSQISKQMGGKKQASEFLNRAGFTGIQYPAGTLSGVSDSKAMNYVLFNDKDLTVKEIKNLSTGNVEKVGGGVPEGARQIKSMRVFHGSPKKFKKLDKGWSRKGDFSHGKGVFVAEKQELAEEFGENIMELDLNANILDMENNTQMQQKYFDWLYENTNPRKHIDSQKFIEAIGLPSAADESIFKFAEENGFDGIRLLERNPFTHGYQENSIFVFNPDEALKTVKTKKRK